MSLKKAVKGKNNMISLATDECLVQNVSLEIVGDDNCVEIRHGARVHNLLIQMIGSGHRLVIDEYCWINGGSIRCEDFNCEVLIGKETSIAGANLSALEYGSRIVIGDDSMLSFDIDVMSSDSHSIIDINSGERINPPGNVRIGRHVWISAHVRVLKGVTIGDNSIIGTCSVVSHDLPSNSLSAGTPARVLRTGVTWIRPRVDLDRKQRRVVNYPPPYWFQQGEALRQVGDYEQAIECFNESIKQEPLHDRSWFAKGLALVGLKEYSQAVACYDRALDINDQAPWVWVDRGYALESMRQFDEAGECYRRALKVDGQYPRALRAIASLEKRRDKDGKAH
jgi:acetyltransferase-like isoleucine patch superfamily enzyme